MDYKQTLDFLFTRFPMFEKIGGGAFNPGLERIEKLCVAFNSPEKKFKSIHIAGTNGKGSSSHLLASVFQAAGYKTGLYTSPHLKSFTERIKINGVEISEKTITDFVNHHFDFLVNFEASFFEITTVLAFDYFAKNEVDIAIIETGLGGRMDATNCILPEVALITNISFDHSQYLGDTLVKIAGEKAGIIKSSTPVVISEKQNATFFVFEEEGKRKQAPVFFAEEHILLTNIQVDKAKMQMDALAEGKLLLNQLQCGLIGEYQEKNIKGVLEVILLMCQMGWNISDASIREGFSEVVESTGLKGRWQILQKDPLIVCDTAHNEAGLQLTIQQLQKLSYARLFFVIGMVKDKDIDRMLGLLPLDAYYCFTQPSIPRALPAQDLWMKALNAGLKGEPCSTVQDALEKAKKLATKNDVIYIGGSTFVVAEII